MNPIAANQARIFWELEAEFAGAFRTDRNLPARLQRRLASERRFGSRDRRLYRELLYTAIRFLPWIEQVRARSEEEAFAAVVWLAAPVPALRMLKEALAHRFGALPDTLAGKAAVLGTDAAVLPDWTADECPPACVSPNADVLHTRAPLWLRLQTDEPQPVLSEFDRLGWTYRPAADLADAVEVLGEVDVTRTEAFARGCIEIQDAGSQLVLLAAAPETGTRWLDACAGAGGKTLQLARLVGPGGGVTAHDIRPAALEELKLRARRASLGQVSIEATPHGLFDGVLVDAPCTGSGTWRRSPHLKWSTSTADIARAADLQFELLNRYSGFVRPGGLLVYATCSLCRSENETLVARFLGQAPGFVPEADRQSRAAQRWALEPGPAGLTIWPAAHNTDGFFVSVLRRRSE